MHYQEVNFDGLIGPSHNYAGLSLGNIASDKHKGEIAFPRLAALQGLEKMWHLVQLGQPQGVLPPASRPDIATLRNLGFSGSAGDIVRQTSRTAPHLLAACYSASAMWAANAATVTASRDSADGRIHFTPANLTTSLHRSIEASYTAPMLQQIFNDQAYFCHHPPLPSQSNFADEGAANHTRLCPDHSHSGINLFIYGRDNGNIAPRFYPARQTREACEALARQHQLPSGNCLLAQQNPEAIDQGVFHNDVICVGHRNFLMLHQQALVDQEQLLRALREQWRHLSPGTDQPLIIAQFSDKILTVSEAVSSYLFNSQLISQGEQNMRLLAPTNCLQSSRVLAAIEWLIQGDNPVSDVEYVDLTQSMNNGGGPACLRLRVPMNDVELSALHPAVLLDFSLYSQLKIWIDKHYREELKPDDLADPNLPLEIETALDDLTNIIGLPKLYPFQV